MFRMKRAKIRRKKKTATTTTNIQPVYTYITFENSVVNIIV